MARLEHAFMQAGVSKIGALITFMGLSLVYNYSTKWAHHHAQSTANTFIFFDSVLADGFRWADEFTGCVFALLADDGIE
jgi:hypothetical protein